MKVRVIGGGLAGSEACYQLLKRGHEVELFEMRGKKMTPCHNTALFAELVCSNSLKSSEKATASGCLKAELELLDSLLIQCAKESAVPAGSALAVDRELFSLCVERKLKSFDKLSIVIDEFDNIDLSIPTIIASGPLTSDNLSENIKKTLNIDNQLHFFDAVAPIIEADSINYEKAFFGGRYGRGDDYLNCAFTREEYDVFYDALIAGESADLHSFERKEIFESCMPVEVMAKRGKETIRYGMMKPVGITNPHNSSRPYAVVQLRKENTEGTMFNIVGFQTNLKFAEQKRIFRLIPGLKNAEFFRYGVMHRNTFLESPKILNSDFSCKQFPLLFFAGQITGVEGYVESIMSGLMSAIALDRKLNGQEMIIPNENTISGALMKYIANGQVKDFQPMNANFGILPPLDKNVRDKKMKKEMYSERAILAMQEYLNQLK